MNRAPLKRLARISSGTGFPIAHQGRDSEQLSFFKVGSLKSVDFRGTMLRSRDTISFQTAVELGAEIIPENSSLMAKIGAATVLGRVGQNPTRCCIDNNLMALIPKVGTHPRFLYYLLHTIDLAPSMNPGAVPNLNLHAFRHRGVPLPEPSSQCAIADYLDRETAEIDAFIADLELAAHLTSVRFEGKLATTFAEVPDWVPLRRTTTLSTGSTPSSSWGEDAFHPDGLEWIGPGDIHESSRLTRGSKRLSQLASSEVRVHRAPAVLVVGIGATVGRVGQVEGPFATNQQITAVTPKSVDAKYLYFALRSLSAYIRKTAHGNTLPIVNNSQLGALRVPLMGSTDQVRLASALDIEMSRTKEVRNEIRQAVDLARQRRTALISAAVTGQIDVTQRHRPVAEELEEEVLQIK